MWTSLGLIAALSLAPGQTGDLDLINIRVTNGFFGSVRPDSKYLPGDRYFVAFDIDNVKVNQNAEVLYSMAMELKDSKNKVLYKRDPEELKALNSLGGNRLPAFAHVEIGHDQAPGAYTLTVTVTDRAAKKTKSFAREFEVLPPTFGVVRVTLSHDVNGNFPASLIGVTGQLVNVNFSAVAFKRDSNDDPNVAVEMNVYDDGGKPTLAKSIVGEVKELPKELRLIPMQFLLALNRPGKFTVKLKATDNISKKTAETSIPITVLELK
jgi:hypothetical protein